MTQRHPTAGNPRSLRSTRRKTPTTEPTTARGRPPKLPATEAEALHGLVNGLMWHCLNWAQLRGFPSRADYDAEVRWCKAANEVRPEIEARLRALTDGR